MHVLGIKDASKVSDEATLGDLGLDSLMAVEIRQYIEREYDMTLNIQEIRALTIARIREISENEKPTGGSAGAAAAAATKSKQDQLAEKRQVASYGRQAGNSAGKAAGAKSQLPAGSPAKHASDDDLTGAAGAPDTGSEATGEP
ncbi:fatty acid synthase, partial [Olea europaea subsp. europaea]